VKRPYCLISSHSHATEPGDLRVKRVPVAKCDRATRIERLGRGAAWIIEGIKDPISSGFGG
jgi:hypothetical protein